MDVDITSVEIPNLSGQITLSSIRPSFNGHYSSVYQGSFQDQLVAVKVIKEINGAKLHTMERKLQRERTTWALLRHPNILPFLGFANDHELFQPFGALISPWRARSNACQFLKDQGNDLTRTHRLKLWKGVVSGVEYLHNHAPVLVHGDLKSANVMIDDEGQPQVCDFGLISIFLEEGHSGMTTTSQHTGTDRYMAYELVQGGDMVTPTVASDTFALGCIGLEFYFMTLPHAHRRNNMQGHIIEDIRAQIPPATRGPVCDSQSEFVWDLLEQCWGIDPSRRPTARELLASLQSQAQPPPLDVNFGSGDRDGDDASNEQIPTGNLPEETGSPSSTPEFPSIGNFRNEPGMKAQELPIGVESGVDMNSSKELPDRRTYTRRLSDVLRESHCMNYEWRPTSFVAGKGEAGKNVTLYRAEFWLEGKAYGSSPNSHLSAEAAREETATYVLPSIIRALKVGKKGKKPSVESI